MVRNIFFDFDGTLMDPRKRLYTLFMELVPEAAFSYDEYWGIKRAKENQQKLLSNRFGYSADKITAFKKQWMARVEDDDLLALDTPYDGASALLKKLSKSNSLHIVTGRQSPEKVKAQIEKSGWLPFIDNLLVTRQIDSKIDLIKTNVAYGGGDIFVGDTGEDILTGKELGMKTIAVTSGFLNQASLEMYKPDYLFKSVVDVNEICSL